MTAKKHPLPPPILDTQYRDMTARHPLREHRHGVSAHTARSVHRLAAPLLLIAASSFGLAGCDLAPYGDEIESTEANIIIGDGDGDSTTPPNAPSNVRVSSQPNASLQVTWRDNSTNEDNFVVHYKLQGSDWEWLASVKYPLGPTYTGVDLSYLHSGLQYDTEYCYRVVAVNKAGSSVSSTTCRRTPKAPPCPDVCDADQSDCDTRCTGDYGETDGDEINCGEWGYCRNSCSERTDMDLNGTRSLNNEFVWATPPTAPLSTGEYNVEIKLVSHKRYANIAKDGGHRDWFCVIQDRPIEECDDYGWIWNADAFDPYIYEQDPNNPYNGRAERYLRKFDGVRLKMDEDYPNVPFQHLTPGFLSSPKNKAGVNGPYEKAAGQFGGKADGKREWIDREVDDCRAYAEQEDSLFAAIYPSVDWEAVTRTSSVSQSEIRLQWIESDMFLPADHSEIYTLDGATAVRDCLTGGAHLPDHGDGWRDLGRGGERFMDIISEKKDHGVPTHYDVSTWYRVLCRATLIPPSSCTADGLICDPNGPNTCCGTCEPSYFGGTGLCTSSSSGSF